MELGLSLGQTPKTWMMMKNPPHEASNKIDFSCSTALSIGLVGGYQIKEPEEGTHHRKKDMNQDANALSPKSNHQLPLQLNLLPHTPLVLHHSNNPPLHLSFQRPTSSEKGSSSEAGFSKRLEVNRLQREDDQEEGEEGPAASSSPNNSAASSFQINLCMYSKGMNQYGKRESDGEGCDQRASSRASDEDDNNSGNRKKLRLSKEQSAFLEQSFKEHSTLNPKEKLALAKKLGLRPRQVEVWFQNRRARTKLKQTEIDCEYMKRYCETLTEENRRLNKELQELRALKTSNPFHMQLPATTLTMCPSCERVGTNSTSAISKTPLSTIHTNGAVSTAASSKANDTNNITSISFPLTRPEFYPFAPT